MIASAPRLWSDYVPVYLKRLRLLDPRHFEGGQQILARFSRYCDPGRSIRIDGIDVALCNAYLARRQLDPGRGGKPLSKASLNKDIRYLNTAFAYAQMPTNEHPDWLGFAPPGWRPPRMKRRKQPKRIPQPVPGPTLRQVLEGAKLAKRPVIGELPPGHWWQTLLLLAVVTGLRCKALLALPRPRDFDLNRNRLLLPAELDKAGEDRLFHLPDLLVSMIREIPAEPGERLFAWPFGRRHFYRTLHQWQRAAGLPDSEHCLPHALKRTKGTMMTEMGCPLPLVSQELSHSNMQVTMDYYIGALTNERREAVEALFAILPLPDDLRTPPDGPNPDILPFPKSG
jgi:integrase